MIQVQDNILLYDESININYLCFCTNLNDINKIHISYKEKGFVLDVYIDNEMLEVLQNERLPYTYKDFYYIVVNHEIIYLSNIELCPFISASDTTLLETEINYLVNLGYDNVNENIKSLFGKNGIMFVGDVFDCQNANDLIDMFEKSM